MTEGGRQQEFEALLAPLLPMAYRVALHLTHNPDDAQDLVQEAALQAFRAFATFTPGTNFKAWLFKIMTNLFLNRHRQQQREPERAALEDVPERYLYTQTQRAGLHAAHADPAALILERLGAEQVTAAIADLPAEMRAVATLSFLEEFGYQEIADILGIPIGTVRSRLHRARRLLQKALWEMAKERTTAGRAGGE